MATFPIQIKVGPHRYTVYRDAARMAQKRYDSGSIYRIGEIEYAKLTIDIDPLIADDLQRTSLFHEVIHACFRLANVAQEGDEKFTNEQAAIALECTLLMVLKDNPDLLAYLMAD